MSSGTGGFGGFDFTPEQQAEFQRLNASFMSLFGTGPNSTPQAFDYNRFLNDPAYQQLIQHQLSRDPLRTPAKQAALNEILGFFGRATEGSTFDKGGGPVDVRGILGGLAQEIEELTQAQIRAGRAEISRGAARATSTAQEGLAGTGLGRSGLAAQQFSDIAQAKEGKIEALGERARTREAEAKARLEENIRRLEISEELRKRGMNEQDIRGMVEFSRQLQRMQFESLLQLAMEPEPSFWEEWGPVFETAGSVGAAIIAA